MRRVLLLFGIGLLVFISQDNIVNAEELFTCSNTLPCVTNAEYDAIFAAFYLQASDSCKEIVEAEPSNNSYDQYVYDQCWLNNGTPENRNGLNYYKGFISSTCNCNLPGIVDGRDFTSFIADKFVRSLQVKTISLHPSSSPIPLPTFIPTATPTIVTNLPNSKLLEDFGIVDSADFGTFGNACWIKLDVIPKDTEPIPDWIPDIAGLRTKVNGYINGMMLTLGDRVSHNVTMMKGRDLCYDGSVPTLYDRSRGLISDKYPNYEQIIDKYISAVNSGQENGDWDLYNNEYADYKCQCADPYQTLDSQLADNGQSSQKAIASSDIKGVSVQVGLDQKLITGSFCKKILNSESRLGCIDVACRNISDSNYCVDCLVSNKTFFSGMADPNKGCLNNTTANICKPLLKVEKLNELAQCVDCIGNKSGVWTAIGCMYTDLGKTINEQLFGLLIGIGGVSVLGCIIFAAFRMQTSSGDPEKLKGAQDMATSCITGLIIIIFSVFILRVIGVDILRIPFLS